MSDRKLPYAQNFPTSFKGIALFTPGGDLLYCIDSTKQNRWHLHLCIALQETLDLKEPPHFLVPGYTATVDCWIMAQTGEKKIAATLSPLVQNYQFLLNTIFNLEENFTWEITPWQEEFCNPIALETYQQDFPQLWKSHELIIKVESQIKVNTNESEQTQGYSLLLFISSQNLPTSETLKNIHNILEEGLNLPYTLKIIDVKKHPEQAEKFQVSAIPTLVRTHPQPIRRIVGGFDNWQRVLEIITK